MSTAFLFPGQGSQVPGMLHTLPDHESVRHTLGEASDFLGRDVLGMDDAEALRSTVSVQLALLISGVAVARTLIAEGVEPLAVAGLSAGAISAAVISGALKFTDGLGLIRQRAEMMTCLFPQGFGVSAIVGLTEEQVREIIRQTDSRDHPLFVANINAPRQIAISGSIEAMEKALELARHRGARKAVRLGVSVPSHCPLFEPVADCLRAALAGMDLEEPRITYIGNITGRALRDAKTIAADITGNVAHTIRWHEGTMVLNELGCRTFFEMPPGHALTELAREALEDARVISISQTSFDYVVKISRGIST